MQWVMEKISYQSESSSSFYNSTNILFMFTKIQDWLSQQSIDADLTAQNKLDSYLEEIIDTILGQCMVDFQVNSKLSLV